ncbi:MAG: LON peptidase substrate-binding domain-containing protein [Acidobacteriota bacterium]
MANRGERICSLPLFPLPDVVHFPRTELRLQVFEPRYRQMVRDLQGVAGGAWIGMVLLQPGWEEDYEGRPPVYSAGTAGRLEHVELLPDGRSNIVLRGDFRFEVTEEFGDEFSMRPYRLARVRRWTESTAANDDRELIVYRKEILASAAQLRVDLGERFEFGDGDLEELAREVSTEALVNRFAAELDVPPLRKLQLLAADLPERAQSVQSILRSRARVLDLLRPFRHLAAGAESN